MRTLSARRQMCRRHITPFLILLCVTCTRSADIPVAVVNSTRITRSELQSTLPRTIEPGRESTVVQEVLEGLIEKELFVQEAVRLGLDSVIALPLELSKKGTLIYELFADLARSVPPPSLQELQNTYRLLSTEVHCRVISVKSETLARRLYGQLKQGVSFETLAVNYSIHPSAPRGGEIAYTPLFYIEEPLRSAILNIKPGEFTAPVFFDSSYEIVLLLESRPTDPPLPPFPEAKQQLEEQIKISRQRRTANEYVSKLRSRLVYNPAGLAVFHKPVDSITESESQLWVAVKDGKKFVKVERLLHIARSFPPGLDTAVRTYAIRRAIEDDLMYEDALARSLDRRPRVKEQLERLRRKLLYETLYNRMVSARVQVTDAEVAEYYSTHRDRYPGDDFNAVAPLIRTNLITERRAAVRAEYLNQLRSRARIKLNPRVLKQVVAELRRARVKNTKPIGVKP